MAQRATGLIVFLLSYFVLLIGIDTPDHPYFDETHYVPAARQLLQTHFAVPTLNLEHPPLAKELMALSIWLFGDNPFGWRTMSALFGALALTGVYLCGRALFDDRRAALWATALAALNQMLFVQARIAMLDIFALAFVLWGAGPRSWRVPFRRTGACAALCGRALFWPRDRMQMERRRSRPRSRSGCRSRGWASELE
jgi:4-amino-4-deoxy-L-arabinose transferase-like glycosyltransferase